MALSSKSWADQRLREGLKLRLLWGRWVEKVDFFAMTYRTKKSKSEELKCYSHLWRSSLKNIYFLVWVLLTFMLSFFFFRCCGFSILI